MKITDKERTTCRLIDELTRTHGFPPTISELSEARGKAQLGSSHKTTRQALRTMRAKGLVSWNDGQARTLRVNNSPK